MHTKQVLETHKAKQALQVTVQGNSVKGKKALGRGMTITCVYAVVNRGVF